MQNEDTSNSEIWLDVAENGQALQVHMKILIFNNIQRLGEKKKSRLSR